MNPTRRAVQRVLLITLIFNLLVATGKIAIGLVSGALSVTADGFHSLMDGSSNIIGLVANHYAAQPPDADHPYGHRRFETLAALLIGALLLLTSWEIIQGALDRLGGGEQPEITPLLFAILIGTLFVNLGVSTYQRRAGRRLNSELLLADAAHTSSDVFVTISVLVSIALVAAGWVWMDAVAALLIVGLIARVAWNIFRQTGSVLVDTAPYSADELAELVGDLPVVDEVLRARSRGPVDAVHIDIDVQVAPQTTTDHTAAIAEAIRDQLNTHLDGIEEIEVHFVPREGDPHDYALIARACADALGLATHDVRLSGKADHRVLELHVEVPTGQTLAQAHEQATRLEHNLQRRLPEVHEVVTHIEPVIAAVDGISTSPAETYRKRTLSLLQRYYPDVDWHHLRVYAHPEGLTATMHARMPSQISIEAAHSIAENAETLLKSQMPRLNRVTIHTEPSNDLAG